MRYRCGRCGVWPAMLEFESDKPECPKCGASGHMVAPLVDVHLVVVDLGGPIQSGGVRVFVACDRKRDVLVPDVRTMYSASDDPRAVTCPRCKGTAEYRERAAFVGLEPAPQQRTTVDLKKGD